MALNRTADGLPMATMDVDGPKSVGILFCVECNNMLYPKEDKGNGFHLFGRIFSCNINTIFSIEHLLILLNLEK